MIETAPMPPNTNLGQYIPGILHAKKNEFKEDDPTAEDIREIETNLTNLFCCGEKTYRELLSQFRAIEFHGINARCVVGNIVMSTIEIVGGDADRKITEKEMFDYIRRVADGQ